MIYNPLAGPANLAGTIQQAAKRWRARGWQITIRPTQAAGHATQLAKQAAAANHRVVIAAGGDGTLAEVANGLVDTQTAMAPLPMGTGNSFGRELHLPAPSLLDPYPLLQSAELLLNGRIQKMDVGVLPNGRFWLLWAGVGADSYVVEKIEPRPKWSKRLGRIGYALQCMAAAPGFGAVHATAHIDGKTVDGKFVLAIICNCRLYAGGLIDLNPQAKLDDGLMELWLFRGQTVDKVFHHLFQAMRGQHIHDPDVIMERGRSFTIHTEPRMPYQTDGDRAGKIPLSCQVKPGALLLLVPPTTPDSLFSQPGQSLQL